MSGRNTPIHETIKQLHEDIRELKYDKTLTHAERVELTTQKIAQLERLEAMRAPVPPEPAQYVPMHTTQEVPAANARHLHEAMSRLPQAPTGSLPDMGFQHHMDDTFPLQRAMYDRRTGEHSMPPGHGYPMPTGQLALRAGDRSAAPSERRKGGPYEWLKRHRVSTIGIAAVATFVVFWPKGSESPGTAPISSTSVVSESNYNFSPTTTAAAVTETTSIPTTTSTAPPATEAPPTSAAADSNATTTSTAPNPNILTIPPNAPLAD